MEHKCAVEIDSDHDIFRPVDLVAVRDTLWPDGLVLSPGGEAELEASILLSASLVLHANLITVIMISEAVGDVDTVLADRHISVSDFCAPVSADFESMASFDMKIEETMSI